MANLPYVTSAGNVTRALNAIAAAATPDAVSQNFVKTILKVPGGSGDQITSFLKKVGFANSDGTPTSIYKRFRNEGTRGMAAADSLRHGYAALYKRNEYAHELSDKDLKGLILEETGQAADSNVATYVLSCFKAIRSFADFKKVEDVTVEQADNRLDGANSPPSLYEIGRRDSAPTQESRPVGLSLGYNINLNLPATSDIAVFNAIFKSLKENLLTERDA